MRAIFILLFAANLVFFGYQYFFAEKNTAAGAVEIKKDSSSLGESLRLLSEQGSASALSAIEKKKRIPKVEAIKSCRVWRKKVGTRVLFNARAVWAVTAG